MAGKMIWDRSPVGFETDKTADEIKSVVGSQKNGPGGKWINNKIYQSLGGSSGVGIPLKLRTIDEIIPISEADAKELLDLKLIKRLLE